MSRTRDLGKIISGNVNMPTISVDSDFTVDTNTLYVDATNNNVGIRTSSPSKPLEVVDTGSVPVLINRDGTGSVGIRFSNNSGQRGVIYGEGTSGGLLFYNQSSEAMRIDSSGHVGIGTASPSVRLAVSRDTNNIFAVERTGVGSGSGQFGINIETSSQTTMSYDDGARLVIGTASTPSTHTGFTERMRIDNNGNLLLGTTSSEGRITIRGNGCGDYIGSITNENSSNCNPAHGLIFRAGINSSASGSNFFSFRRPDNTVLGSITQSGSTSISYNTSSDYRLKENVVALTGAADRLAQIPVHRFNFIEEPDKTVDGFIAHEVQAFVPEAVIGEKDGTRVEQYEATPAVYDEEGNLVSQAVMAVREVPDYQGIDQSKLVPLLTAALQEALQKIDSLETRIATLEGN